MTRPRFPQERHRSGSGSLTIAKRADEIRERWLESEPFPSFAQGMKSSMKLTFASGALGRRALNEPDKPDIKWNVDARLTESAPDIATTTDLYKTLALQ